MQSINGIGHMAKHEPGGGGKISKSVLTETGAHPQNLSLTQESL